MTHRVTDQSEDPGVPCDSIALHRFNIPRAVLVSVLI